MGDEVKITVIATGFRADPQRRERVSAAAAAIASTRTAAAYATPEAGDREPHAQAPGAPSAKARPSAPPVVPRRPAPERETSLDPVRNVNANFDQDDLDVPAFIRKRRDQETTH